MALGLLMLAFLSHPIQAEAHAFLAQSSPQPGQRLVLAPRTLRLQFTEAISPGGLQLTVTPLGGPQVSVGHPSLLNQGTTVAASLPALEPGVYRVNWQVISEDGHPSAGQFAFAVGIVGRLPAATSTSSSPTDWPGIVASWVLLAGLALGAGRLAGDRLIWSSIQHGEAIRTGRLPVAPALVLAITGATAQMILAGTATRSGISVNLQSWATLLGTKAAWVSLVTATLILIALALYWLSDHRDLALAALVAAVAVNALRTHPAVSGYWWSLPVVAVHVVFAVLWIGLLAQLVTVLWSGSLHWPGELLVPAVRRYARLAFWSATLVLGTGVLSALPEIKRLDHLVDTDYGRILVAKTVLVVLALGLAGLIRLRSLHRLSSGGPRLVRHLTPLELGALASVLVVATILGGTAPPFTGLAVATETFAGLPPVEGPQLVLAGQAGWLEVYLTASQGQLTLQVISPDSTTPADVQVTAMSATTPDGKTVDLFPRRCFEGCVSMRFDWPAGTTMVQFAVATKAWSGGRIGFAVPWPPLPADPALLARVINVMRSQPEVTIDERVSSGPGATAHSVSRTSGQTLAGVLPYAGPVSDVRPLPTAGTMGELAVYLSGSQIWAHLWIDPTLRVVREVIVAPGHLLEHTFTY